MSIYNYTNFISNIDYRVTKYCLYDLLIQITLIKSLEYKTKIAFVEYYSEQDRNNSYNLLNNIKLYTRKILFQKVEPLSLITFKSINSIDSIQNDCSKYGSCRVLLNKNTYNCYFRKESEMKNAVSNLSTIYKFKIHGFVFNKNYKQIFKNTK